MDKKKAWIIIAICAAIIVIAIVLVKYLPVYSTLLTIVSFVAGATIGGIGYGIYMKYLKE
jgi:hypothetical protein